MTRFALSGHRLPKFASKFLCLQGRSKDGTSLDPIAQTMRAGVRTTIGGRLAKESLARTLDRRFLDCSLAY
jgi:hypothetical protein